MSGINLRAFDNLRFSCLEDKRLTPALQQLAKDNGFSYTARSNTAVHKTWRKQHPQAQPIWYGGHSFLQKEYNYASHIMSGTYRNYDVQLFALWHMSGDNYVIRVKLPKVFPQIFLDSHQNDVASNGRSIPIRLHPSQRLQLEGDFDAHFDLYVPAGLHINALSVLAPNMMEILAKHSQLFDVEFYGDELILSTREFLYTPERMRLLDKALSAQLTYLTRLMSSWSYSPKQPPFDVLQIMSTSSGTVKVGKYRLGDDFLMILFIVIMCFALTILYIAIPDEYPSE